MQIIGRRGGWGKGLGAIFNFCYTYMYIKIILFGLELISVLFLIAIGYINKGSSEIFVPLENGMNVSID